MTVTLKLYSMAEVAKNNGKAGADSWMVIRDNVYDVTGYMDKHPGGRDLLEEYAGKDATKAFDEFGHSSTADGDLKAFKIGELTEEDRKKKKAGKSEKTEKAAEKSSEKLEENQRTHVSRSLITRITCGLLR